MNNNSALTKHKDHLPRAARRSGDSRFDRIWNYYHDPKRRVLLKPVEEAMRARAERAWMLMTEVNTPRNIRDIIMKEFGVSDRSAYSDMDRARMLFGNPEGQHKAARRAMVSEWLEVAIKKAKDREDWDTFDKLVLRYTKIHGLDKETNNELAEMIKNRPPATVVFVTDKTALQEDADALMQGVEDPDVTDIGYEEQTDGGDAD